MSDPNDKDGRSDPQNPEDLNPNIEYTSSQKPDGTTHHTYYNREQNTRMSYDTRDDEHGAYTVKDTGHIVDQNKEKGDDDRKWSWW